MHGFKSQLATNSVKIKSPKAEVTELPMGICQISNLDKNMNKIQIFQNEQFGKVRITMNENDEPLFCLADVAKALGYSNPAKAVIDHCKGVTV